MKKYQYRILIATIFGLGHPVLADYCCYDQVRCVSYDQPHNPEVLGVLYGGQLRKYEFFFGMGCYPTELYVNAFESSRRACSEQFPEKCGGDKCFVKKFDNKCGTTGKQTPLGPALPPPSPEMKPVKDPRDICSKLLDRCKQSGSLVYRCSHFKNDEAKAQCQRGPEPPENAAVNCFNGCKIEQHSGACRKDVEKPGDGNGRCQNPLNGQYYDG